MSETLTPGFHNHVMDFVTQRKNISGWL